MLEKNYKWIEDEKTEEKIEEEPEYKSGSTQVVIHPLCKAPLQIAYYKYNCYCT